MHSQLARHLIEALPMIPPRIVTRMKFEIGTTGAIWRLPPQFGQSPVNWATFRTTPEMLAVLQGYIAFLLETRSESTAGGEATRLTRVDWRLLTEPWERYGQISQADILAIRADLKHRFPRAWTDYGPVVKRVYVWAADMGVPGFSEEVAFHLRRMRSKKRPSLEAQTRVAPGVDVSKNSKHRQCYDELTAARIEGVLLKAVRDLRVGIADPHIKLSAIVLTYLALDHGQRPLSFAKLRESHFEARETEGAICYWLEIPACKRRKQTAYINQTMCKQLSSEWGGLIADLIAQNQAKREKLGLDNTLDWPLFPVQPTGRPAQQRMQVAVPHPDPMIQHHKRSECLNYELKALFKALKVPDGKGGILIPTFYSFRDTFDTQLAKMGTPLSARARALGQTTTMSTRGYDKRGPEFVAMLDQPFLREKLEALAEPFLKGARFSVSREEGPEVPCVDPDTGIYLGATGRCGCPGSPCGLSGTIECYLCGNFRAIVEGPHVRVMAWMQDRRARMIAEGKPEAQSTRYDIAIFVVEELQRRIDRISTEEGA